MQWGQIYATKAEGVQKEGDPDGAILVTAWCLKATETFSRSSGGGKLKINMSAGQCFLSIALGEHPSRPLLAPGGSRCSLAYGSITPLSASIFTWSSSPCVSVSQSPFLVS